MKIIQSESKLPFFVELDNGYQLNFNQHKIKIQSNTEDQDKEVYEIYQEEFKTYPTIRGKMEAIKSGLDHYYTSSAVKRFTLNSVSGWIESESRISILHEVEVLAGLGKQTYTLWLDPLHPFNLKLDDIKSLLDSVEVYSAECYNVTAEYIKFIEDNGADLDAICGLTFTENYPTKLNFELEVQ